MQVLITPEEFAIRAIGVPWVKWRSDWNACDCFGLIVLWFREVHGIDLGPVPQTDIAHGFNEASGWEECAPQAGATCFMAWKNGAPTHCGVLFTSDTVLHSEGSDAHAGSVRITRLALMRRVYGELKFYRRSAC